MKTHIRIFLALLGCAVTAAHATPVTGSVSAGVSAAGIWTWNNSSTTGDSWAATPASLLTSASAYAGDQVDDPDDDNPFHMLNWGQAFLEARADWAADGNSGTIAMFYSWISHGPTGVNAFNTNLGPYNWSYTFVADANGTFVMDYNVVGAGGTFGLWGFTLSHNLDSGAGAPVTDASDPTSSGQFVGEVIAGQIYTVSLMNSGNIHTDVGFGNYSGSVTADFSWSIQPDSVPDASTSLPVLLCALGGLGAMNHRSRRRLA